MVMQKMPVQVAEFVSAAKRNAAKVWDSSDEVRDDARFIDGLLYVHTNLDGSWEVSDNYERFFSTIYTWRDGQWFARSMYSESRHERSLSHAAMLATADILYTG